MSDIRSLQHHQGNPRKISEDQLRRLGKSIEQLGDISGIVYNRRTQRLVGGHQRTKVLPSDAEITITERYETPTAAGTVALGHIVAWGERYTYREVDWDDGRETLAMLGANKHGGEWDYALLSDRLVEIDQLSLDLDLSGFTFDEFSNILAPLSAPGELQSHALDHTYTFTIRCTSDDQINRIRDFFGVMRSGVDYDKFEERCL
jgi:hypothetical protein